MYGLENLRREESLSNYTKRKLSNDIVIVTDNLESYEEKINVISYQDYIDMIRNNGIEEKEFFVDDLKKLLLLIGTKEAVVQNRFILR